MDAVDKEVVAAAFEAAVEAKPEREVTSAAAAFLQLRLATRTSGSISISTARVIGESC